MSKVDWSLAREGYPLWLEDLNPRSGGDMSGWHRDDGDRYTDTDGMHWLKKDHEDYAVHARPKQPQAWSGPEDGLPPVGTVCEHHKLGGIISGDAEWREVKILAHVTDDARISPVAVYMPCNGHVPCVGQAIAECFKPIKTAEKIDRDARESAIRELMDIAQVDCRVTAARLVDAGFKREGK